MRSAALIALVGVVVLGAAGILLGASADQRRLAFTLGVAPEGGVAPLRPGAEVCQAPIYSSAPFRLVAFEVDVRELPTPLQVEVRDLPGGGRLGAGRLAPPYAAGALSAVDVGPVAGGRRISVCVRNAGRYRVDLAGGPAVAARTSTASVRGRSLRKDLTLVFLRGEPRSALELAPEMVRRAALFRPGWVSARLLWVLLGAVVTLVPALLVLALRSAGRQTP